MSWIFSKIFSYFIRNPFDNNDDQLILIRLQNELQRIREQNKNVEVISVSEDLKEWKIEFKKSSSNNFEGIKTDYFHNLSIYNNFNCLGNKSRNFYNTCFV